MKKLIKENKSGFLIGLMYAVISTCAIYLISNYDLVRSTLLLIPQQFILVGINTLFPRSFFEHNRVSGFLVIIMGVSLSLIIWPTIGIIIEKLIKKILKKDNSNE